MRKRITGTLSVLLLAALAGCAAPTGLAARMRLPANPLMAPDMAFQVEPPLLPWHRPPVQEPTYSLQQVLSQPWGIQIRQGKATYSLEYNMMPGYRFRFYRGMYSNPMSAVGNQLMYDTVITDRNCDVGGYTGRGSWYWISAWRDTVSEFGNIWWQPQSHPTAKVQQMQATNNGFNQYTTIMTGYVYLPRKGNYRFRCSQSSAPWYGWNVDSYLQVGQSGWWASNGRTSQDTNALWTTNSAAQFNAGPVAFTYATPSCHTSCGGYYFMYSTDNGATWERFPDNAFQIRTDLGNQQPVLTGGTTTFQLGENQAQFLTRGSARLTGSPSTTSTDAYDPSFDPTWKGKITKVNYVVPAESYLVLHSVYSYDFINTTARNKYPVFITLDNMIVDAPLAGNGLKGSMIYGPGEVLSIGVPILTPVGGTYRPEVILSGNLVNKAVFESGGGFTCPAK